MKTNTQGSVSKAALTIRFDLTDGSVHSFVQPGDAAARKIWEAVDPTRLFARPRIVIGSERSKTVFVSSEIIRIEFLHESFQCWEAQIPADAWLAEPVLHSPSVVEVRPPA